MAKLFTIAHSHNRQVDADQNLWERGVFAIVQNAGVSIVDHSRMADQSPKFVVPDFKSKGRRPSLCSQTTEHCVVFEIGSTSPRGLLSEAVAYVSLDHSC